MKENNGLKMKTIMKSSLFQKGLEGKYKCNIIFRLYCAPIPPETGVKIQKKQSVG